VINSSLFLGVYIQTFLQSVIVYCYYIQHVVFSRCHCMCGFLRILYKQNRTTYSLRAKFKNHVAWVGIFNSKINKSFMTSLRNIRLFYGKIVECQKSMLWTCGKWSSEISYKQYPAAVVISYRVPYKRLNYLPHFSLGRSIKCFKKFCKQQRRQ
jgi:hypothetical protein